MIKHASNLVSRSMLLLVAFTVFLPAQIHSQSKATIIRKRIVIVRSGKFAKDFPDRKRATISYPFVTGLRDRVVLGKVRSLLSVGNVFQTSFREYRENNWLDEFDYIVNYNANNILDVTFTQSGMAAYPDSQARTISIDLRTGNVITAKNIFAVRTLAELARLVDAKLQADIAQVILAAKADRQLTEASSIVEALEEVKFEVKDLDDFSINKDGVTFLYEVGFPHVHRAFEPGGHYLFSYSELRPFISPDGPLGQFVK
ncbi:MAG TPA: hypothetical protein VL866_06530 [Pyrinomonadaceae bacterium]|nr:hypothetical protein [Pyrinomonadaceae bacterium]